MSGSGPSSTAAFAGAVLLILLRVITADEAYRGLRPEVLMLIAGMVVLGIALEETGLAASTTRLLIGTMDQMSPFLALVIIYGVTLFATELLSNATVAVLFTPVAVSMLNTDQAAGWAALLDLYESHLTGWTLVDGQMVYLWCAARGRPVPPTTPTPCSTSAAFFSPG